MKILDRYIIRELLKPFICASIALIFLLLIADLFDHLDEFLRYKTPPQILLKYYVALIPGAFQETLHWAAWLGTIFLLVNFGLHNEIIAMKAAGLKITALSKPIVFLGFLLGILAFLVSDRVVPPALKLALRLKDFDMKAAAGSELKQAPLQNVTYLARNEELYYFTSFSPQKKEVEYAVGLWLDPKMPNTRRKMSAKRGVWRDNQWVFYEVNEYQMDSRGRILGDPKIFAEKSYPEIPFGPAELESVSRETNYLTYRELQKSVEELRQNNVPARAELVDLHSRLAKPWQALVMMTLCIPFLSKTTNRKLIAANVLVAIIAAFSFHVLDAIGIALGKAGKLFPFLGAWLGNIVFGTATFILLERGND